jgi:hypothetical protein
MPYLVEYRITRETAKQYLTPRHADLIEEAVKWWPVEVYDIGWQAEREANTLPARIGFIAETRIRIVPPDHKAEFSGPAYWWNDPRPQ